MYFQRMKYLTFLFSMLLLLSCESDMESCPPIDTDIYGPWMPYSENDSLYVPAGNDSTLFVVTSAEHFYDPEASSGTSFSSLCFRQWSFAMASKDDRLSFCLYEDDFTQAVFTINGKTLSFDRFAKDTLIGNTVRKEVAVFGKNSDTAGVHNIVLEYDAGLIAIGRN